MADVQDMAEITDGRHSRGGGNPPFGPLPTASRLLDCLCGFGRRDRLLKNVKSYERTQHVVENK